MANKLVVANIATAERVEISNAVFNNGNPYFLNKNYPTAKWCQKYHVHITGTPEQNGKYTRYFLTADEGWEFVNEGAKPRKERTPKRTPKKPAPKPAPTPSEQTPETPKAPETPETPKEEPTPTPAPAPTPKVPETPTPAPKKSGNDNDEVQAIMNLLAALKGKGNVNEEEVRRIVQEEITNASAGRVVKIQINKAEPKELPNGQEPHPLLNKVMTMVVNDRVIGRYPWLYGPAGSGKSTLAKQVADALGLPFYSVSSLQQKYELEGYTDATGELVKTVFYKAAKEGGVFCFDEISTTSPEVQVAFNSMLANLWYNFPKEGMVTAHPDFHIIAADNTTGRGGDARYCARFQTEASTLDRYTFVEVDYTEEHDLRMANGDKDLVKFMKEVRKVLDDAQLTYLATPRASKAIKAFEAAGMADDEAMWYGLCSGWNRQDLRTVISRVKGDGKWFTAFRNCENK